MLLIWFLAHSILYFDVDGAERLFIQFQLAPPFTKIFGVNGLASMVWSQKRQWVGSAARVILISQVP